MYLNKSKDIKPSTQGRKLNYPKLKKKESKASEEEKHILSSIKNPPKAPFLCRRESCQTSNQVTFNLEDSGMR